MISYLFFWAVVGRSATYTTASCVSVEREIERKRGSFLAELELCLLLTDSASFFFGIFMLFSLSECCLQVKA